MHCIGHASHDHSVYASINRNSQKMNDRKWKKTRSGHIVKPQEIAQWEKKIIFIIALSKVKISGHWMTREGGEQSKIATLTQRQFTFVSFSNISIIVFFSLHNSDASESNNLWNEIANYRNCNVHIFVRLEIAWNRKYLLKQNTEIVLPFQV